jgi:UTP--glucose-1-phosphate uridylyltransferase
MKIRKAIIPAAGLGTRFLPATKAMPKEMLPIVDKPTIQYIVEEAVASGIEDIIIVTGKGKRAIEDHFDNSFELEFNLAEKQKWELLESVRKSSEMADIHYIRQKEPRGLGMPFGVHVNSSAMNRLLSCLVMTLWSRINLV